MRDYLSPLASKTSYNMLDATTILLREGLEGLLVVVALLGFLKNLVMQIRVDGFGSVLDRAWEPVLS